MQPAVQRPCTGQAQDPSSVQRMHVRTCCVWLSTRGAQDVHHSGATQHPPCKFQDIA